MIKNDLQMKFNRLDSMGKILDIIMMKDKISKIKKINNKNKRQQ